MDLELNLGAQLGATEAPATQRLTLYIPDKDRADRKIKGHSRWVKEAQELLTRIGRGSTTLPPVDGTWEMPDGGVLWEKTRIIYTFIDPDRFDANLPQLREFLHRFGRESNQGEVRFEFDGRLWSITEYDPLKPQ